jgi:predicted O-methyltransferase YrrM
MEFGDAFEVAQRVGITQKPEEIGWLFERVREARPRIVLEIGLDRGGTLFLWSRVAAADAHLVAVDTSPGGAFGAWSPFQLVRRSFARDQQRVTLLMGCDSHATETFDRVRRAVAGANVDFMFIDGDHTYGGVSRDFDTYSRLVRPGGLVAFHDVSQAPTAYTEGTARFWREFAAEHETDQCVVDGEPGFGIGLYTVLA